MVVTDRYRVGGSLEGEDQHGSGGRVLANRLGITDVEQMEEVEFRLLDACQTSLYQELGMDQCITLQDLKHWHSRWLNSVYDWAGSYRTVNITKGGFPFATWPLIDSLMDSYSQNFLSKFTPCFQMTDSKLIEALALCHVEFILIHPFREGNGRIARILATVMALQANKFISFADLESDKNSYIQAIHEGHKGNYEPMKTIFSALVFPGE